jgi:hypothetical protein
LGPHEFSDVQLLESRLPQRAFALSSEGAQAVAHSQATKLSLKLFVFSYVLTMRS